MITTYYKTKSPIPKLCHFALVHLFSNNPAVVVVFQGLNLNDDKLQFIL